MVVHHMDHGMGKGLHEAAYEGGNLEVVVVVVVGGGEDGEDGIEGEGGSVVVA